MLCVYFIDRRLKRKLITTSAENTWIWTLSVTVVDVWSYLNYQTARMCVPIVDSRCTLCTTCLLWIIFDTLSILLHCISQLSGSHQPIRYRAKAPPHSQALSRSCQPNTLEFTLDVHIFGRPAVRSPFVYGLIRSSLELSQKKKHFTQIVCRSRSIQFTSRFSICFVVVCFMVFDRIYRASTDRTSRPLYFLSHWHSRSMCLPNTFNGLGIHSCSVYACECASDCVCVCV